MTICIEPGVYARGVGNMKLEDDFVITEDGCEALTSSDATLEVLAVIAGRPWMRAANFAQVTDPAVTLRPDQTALIEGDITAQLRRAGPARAALRGTCWRSTASGAATSSRSRPVTTGASSRRCWARCAMAPWRCHST